MSLTIRGKEDLKQMVGYHIDDVEVIPGVAGLQFTLSHITEPGVKYRVAIIPDVKPSLNGNLLMIDRGLIVQSIGIVATQ